MLLNNVIIRIVDIFIYAKMYVSIAYKSILLYLLKKMKFNI